VFFLIESDSLHFDHESGFVTSEKANFQLQKRLLGKLTDDFDLTESDGAADVKSTIAAATRRGSVCQRAGLLSTDELRAFTRIIKSKIPLHAAFSIVCDRVWNELVAALSFITVFPIWQVR
jgi:hypothetical protein